MEPFELTKLTAGSFERLVRALCFHHFGPSGTVFSAGPDGARDFTVEGNIKGYEPRKWEGYLVVQAKFREKPKGGIEDIEWLKSQLASEFQKFKESANNLRAPNYYILATNVSLSGADGLSAKKQKRKGGHTKISEEFTAWKKSIGILDFDIWPHDKIIDLLAGAPEIRKTYAAWITSGDVLSQLLSDFKSRCLSFPDLIRRCLKSGLRRDQHSRLKDAGSVSEAQVRISQVFVDLPVKLPATLAASFRPTFESDADENERATRVVSCVVHRSREKLNPDPLIGEDRDLDHRPSSNKIVLLGGPGQGKSTAGTFITQLFRAALLEKEASTQRDDTVQPLVMETLSRCAREGITKSFPRRYPVLVSLPRMADAISSAKKGGGKVPSILSMIAYELSTNEDEVVSISVLREWLGAYPWIVVLDGLDEVPPSGERAAVIDAINTFTSELSDSCSDTLVITTTRPQGYNNDLSSQHWEHWSLEDLTQERAIAYASALCEAKYPEDKPRQADILRALEGAVNKPATSRLMISPLQVTIMYMIVDTGGSVPAARWSLFNEYFEVLRKREKSKGGETQSILERNWGLLGPIHHRAGLLLQTESEKSGGALAYLSPMRLSELIREYLSSEGHDQLDIDVKVAELSFVALNRLVLLSAKEENKISFDVRSMQEFMAAAALTSQDPHIIELRLIALAGISHWRHVILIAASRCFAEDAFHHRRGSTVGVPRALESDDVERISHNGARLALDMLIDGIGADYPIARKQLAAHALELLALGPDNLDVRLTHILDPQTSDLIESKLKERIAEGCTPAALAAWKLLSLLCDDAFPRFSAIALEMWPQSTSTSSQVLSVLSIGERSSTSLANLLLSELFKFGPAIASRVFLNSKWQENARTKSKSKEHDAISNLQFIFRDLDRRESYPVLSSKKSSPLSFYLNCTTKVYAPNLDSQIKTMPNWTPIIAALEFAASPSAKSLASAMDQIASANCLESAKSLASIFLWPLSEHITHCKDLEDLRHRVDKARRGDYGDLTHWHRAEARWKKNGVTEDDLVNMLGDDGFSESIAVKGFPDPKSYGVSVRDLQTPVVVHRLVKIASAMADSAQKAKLTQVIEFCLTSFPKESRINDVDEIHAVLDVLNSTLTDLTKKHYIAIFGAFGKAAWSDPRFLQFTNQALSTLSFFYGEVIARLPDSDDIISAFILNPDKKGLLLLIASIISSDPEHFDSVQRLAQIQMKVTQSDSPRIRLAALLLSGIVAQKWETKKISSLLTSGQLTGNDLYLVKQLFSLNMPNNHEKTLALSQLIRELEGKAPHDACSFQEQLRKCLDARQANLSERKVWIDSLKLPADAFEVLVND